MIRGIFATCYIVKDRSDSFFSPSHRTSPVSPIPYHVPADFFSADFFCCSPCVRRLFFCHQPIFLINHFFAGLVFFGTLIFLVAGPQVMLVVFLFRVFIRFFTQRNRRYTTIWLIFFLIFSFLSRLRFLVMNYLSARIISYPNHKYYFNWIVKMLHHQSLKDSCILYCNFHTGTPDLYTETSTLKGILGAWITCTSHDDIWD